MKRRLRAQQGISLIELVLYAALFILVSIGAVNLLLQSYRTLSDMRLQRIINTNGELAMQRMVREIRDAYAVDAGASVFDATPGALRLNTFSDASGVATTTADMRVISGRIHLTKGTESVDLTSSDVSVDSLFFRHILSPVSDAVAIELVLTASSTQASIRMPLYATVITRGSY